MGLNYILIFDIKQTGCGLVTPQIKHFALYITHAKSTYELSLKKCYPLGKDRSTKRFIKTPIKIKLFAYQVGKSPIKQRNIKFYSISDKMCINIELTKL